MATVCDHCGYKDNEVKAGAGIEDKGRKITLHVTDPSDLNRDVLKVSAKQFSQMMCISQVNGRSLCMKNENHNLNDFLAA